MAATVARALASSRCLAGIRATVWAPRAPTATFSWLDPGAEERPAAALATVTGVPSPGCIAARLFERDRVLLPGRAVWVDEDTLFLGRGGRRQARYGEGHEECRWSYDRIHREGVYTPTVKRPAAAFS
jgi:hypothetical protein